jgi:nucleotide-binding universal stress UspA family protein
MKTILVPVDFSPVSRKVVAEAIELAKVTRARIVLMHSVPPAPIIATDLAPLAGSALQLTDDLEKAADRHLQRMQRDLKGRGIPVDTVCTSGFPVTHILAQAKELGASYIVIGSHGHTAFYDLVIGSIASGVLKRAPCPVIVVPPVKKAKARRQR